MSTIYFHWPFCVSKCFYCDFNSVSCKKDTDFKRWYVLFEKNLLTFLEKFYHNESVTSVYFGGGTPSLLPVWFVSGLLRTIKREFVLDGDAEITLEANPKTISKEKAIRLRESGVNRLSIGVQSIIDSDLKMLGRIHNAEEAKACVFEMAEVFDNLSIDMIYNRPKQEVDSWKKELEEVLEYPISHASLYELIIEDKTRMKLLIESGALPKPSDSSEFFEKTIEISKAKGFEMYEVSNFAKDKHYGRHNTSYWKYEDYYGIGPGAHSRCSVSGRKIAIGQERDISKWPNWAEHSNFEAEYLSKEEEFEERLIMGLRSKCGIRLSDFDPKIKQKFDLKNKIEKLKANSYIIDNGENVILTYDGIMRLNLIVEYLAKE